MSSRGLPLAACLVGSPGLLGAIKAAAITTAAAEEADKAVLSIEIGPGSFSSVCQIAQCPAT
jgi:hypothetical protein